MKKVKRLLSILVALAMVLSLNTMVFAASSDDNAFSIIINDAADGEMYTAYKIFDVTYDDDNYSYTIDSNSAWYSIVSDATDVFTLTEINGSDTYNVTVNDGVSDTDITGVFTNVGVPEQAVVAASVQADAGMAVLDVSSSGAGYYYVTTTLGALVMIDTTHPSAEIDEKNGIPVIFKTERDETYDEDFVGDGDTSDNGDFMEYKLDVTSIQGVADLVIHDYLDDQLLISTLFLEGITINDGELIIPLEENVDYWYTTSTCGGANCGMEGCSFEISFRDGLFDDLSVNAYLEILYDIQIDESQGTFKDLVDEIDNYANVTFGASGVGTPVVVDTYSFGFNVYKYTGDIEESTPLAGAKFVLKNEAGEYATYKETEEENVYLLTGWVTSIDEASVFVTPDDGQFTIEGLHDGTFYLEETEAPDGYNKLTKDITVTITAVDDYPGEFTVTVDDIEASDKTANVENNTGSILPGTGGMGTTLFYIIGAILVCGAVVLLVSRRRMHSAE